MDTLLVDPLLRPLALLAVVALASHFIGRFLNRYKLPLITGFLFVGALAGPYLLGLFSRTDIEHLLFVDEISLAFIALAAGSELRLKQLKGRLRSVGYITLGLTVSTFVLGSTGVFLLSEYIPFMTDLPTASRVAISLLAGVILVARSPSSAIAIVKELRASGPFTQTVLGVTVAMDVVVIALFSVNSAVADALLHGMGFGGGTLMLLIGELTAAGLLGIGFGFVVCGIMLTRLPDWAKDAVVLGLGYGVYSLSFFVRHYTDAHLPFEVLIEPLLVCMIAGFFVTNFSRYGNEFAALLERAGPLIYVLFFTLAGSSLRLDILQDVWIIAVILSLVRLAGIYIGSLAGGYMAGEPRTHQKVSWMSYVTQAGIGLGLAQEVAVEFPTWGWDFATVMISVIVINQVVGPILLKGAIQFTGEANAPAKDPQKAESP